MEQSSPKRQCSNENSGPDHQGKSTRVDIDTPLVNTSESTQTLENKSACSMDGLSEDAGRDAIKDETKTKAKITSNLAATQQSSLPSSSREMLNEQAQMLIDEVNAKRKRDTALLGEYKKALEIQASDAYSTVEQNVFLLYEQNGKQLQEKLQELFATLDRIANLEQELEQFRVSLGALYKEVN